MLKRVNKPEIKPSKSISSRFQNHNKPSLLSLTHDLFRLTGRPITLVIIHLIEALPKFSSLIQKLNYQPKGNVTHLFNFRSQLNWRLLLAAAFISPILVGAHWLQTNVLNNLPQPEELVNRHQKLTTQIFDRHGQLLYKIYDDQNRTLVPLSAIPTLTQQAFIAAEDRNFYAHHGIDLVGTVRAIWHNLTSAKLEGGSTITQQLVKNALLSPQRSLSRKLKEMLLAIEVEMVYSKADLLQMYLNEVGFGGPVYGIQEAAQQYFGKNVSDLSLAESALLAGLPKAPTKFSPLASGNLSKNRQQYVLTRMQAEGYISADQAKAANDEPLNFRPPTIPIKAPHFVQFVREWLVDQLGEDLVNQGGLQVHTTLDYSLQQQAEEQINLELARIKSANVSNGAVLVTRPTTGEILVMVGSHNYFDIDNDGQVNLTTALRQPGSTVKPINYSSAFEQGLTPSAIVLDQPVSFNNGYEVYTPTNYDSRYHGQITVRTALANSYNVPAVVTLAHYGVEQMANLGYRLGITSWNNPSRWGLSLTLGGIEVSMVDLAEAYGTFANLGTRVPLTAVTSVFDTSGKQVDLPHCLLKPNYDSCQPMPTLKSSTAYMVNSILSDQVARIPAFGVNSVLNIPRHQVAVKTGTSNDFRDNWTIGYTSDILVASWVGNNDNRPMSKVASGITGASPIWKSIITPLLDQSIAHVFPAPDSIVSLSVCPTSGGTSCHDCDKPKLEIFVKGTQPSCGPPSQTANAGRQPGKLIKTDKLSNRINLN